LPGFQAKNFHGHLHGSNGITPLCPGSMRMGPAGSNKDADHGAMRVLMSGGSMDFRNGVTAQPTGNQVSRAVERSVGNYFFINAQLDAKQQANQVCGDVQTFFG
jgi:hypothetical protein